jgi:hypothetical protein
MEFTRIKIGPLAVDDIAVGVELNRVHGLSPKTLMMGRRRRQLKPNSWFVF